MALARTTNLSAACVQFMSEVVEKGGCLASLVNNAGIGVDEAAIATDEIFTKPMDTNLEAHGTMVHRLSKPCRVKTQRANGNHGGTLSTSWACLDSSDGAV